MPEIEVSIKDCWTYNFYVDGKSDYPYSSRICPYCEGTLLSKSYCDIIDNLKEADLLDKDYKEICCACLVLKRFGLLDIRGRLAGIMYNPLDDSMLIEFLVKKVYPRDLKAPYLICIKIHDWKKIDLFE